MKEKTPYLQDGIFNLDKFFSTATAQEVIDWIGISQEQFEVLFEEYNAKYKWLIKLVDKKTALFITLYFLTQNSFSDLELKQFHPKFSGSGSRKNFCRQAFGNLKEFVEYQEQLTEVVQTIPNKDQFAALFGVYLTSGSQSSSQASSVATTPASTPPLSRSSSFTNLSVVATPITPIQIKPSKQEPPYSAPAHISNNNNSPPNSPYRTPKPTLILRRAASEPIKRSRSVVIDPKKFIIKRNDFTLFFNSKKLPYKNVEVEGNQLHLSLQQISNAAFNKFNTPQMQNVVIGNIGFVISDRPLSHAHQSSHPQGKPECLHGRKIVSFPLKIDLNKKSISIINKEFFDDIPPQELLEVINYLKKLAKEYLGKDFEQSKTIIPQNDQHSEALICYLLFQDKVVEFLADELVKKLPMSEPGFRNYGIVLDFHSKNSMCCNCALLMLGLQLSNNENGFLKKFRAALANRGFVKTEKELRLIVRYSYDEKFRPEPSIALVKDETKEKHPEKDIKRLFERKHLIHAKEASFWREEPEKRTGFFSGFRKGSIEEVGEYGESQEQLTEEFTSEFVEVADVMTTTVRGNTKK